MQSVSSRNWTRVAVSISYDDNHYTTGTSTKHHGHLHIDRTLSDATTPVESGPWERWQWRGTPYSPKLQHQITHYIQDSHWGGFLFLCRDAIGVFYSSCRLGHIWPETDQIIRLLYDIEFSEIPYLYVCVYVFVCVCVCVCVFKIMIQWW